MDNDQQTVLASIQDAGGSQVLTNLHRSTKIHPDKLFRVINELERAGLVVTCMIHPHLNISLAPPPQEETQ